METATISTPSSAQMFFSRTGELPDLPEPLRLSMQLLGIDTVEMARSRPRMMFDLGVSCRSCRHAVHCHQLLCNGEVDVSEESDCPNAAELRQLSFLR